MLAFVDTSAGVSNYSTRALTSIVLVLLSELKLKTSAMKNIMVLRAVSVGPCEIN